MSFKRSSGILLHPTSLPSRFGIGDLGTSAYGFIDFLEASGQKLWQVLPLGPTGYGNSPYMCFSAIAGSPMLISPDLLIKQELLWESDLESLPDFERDFTDFDRVIPYKTNIFRLAYDRFKNRFITNENPEFTDFCANQSIWLDDYALFMAILETYEHKPWHTWEEAIAQREPEAIRHHTELLQEQISFHKFLQFQFFKQWAELRGYANQKEILIIGDIPIYVAHNSADVWANPSIFVLDPESFEPALMAGVPPDYFSETGQLWGNPVYNWEVLQQDNFSWWINRFKFMLQYVDIIRIDHFRGFESFWQVPSGEDTAINGEWKLAPGQELFTTLRAVLGGLPILAEDLGIITPEVEALRDQFEFPGMRILLFAFGGDSNNIYLPHHYVKNSLVYTGTHDNDTAVGWWQRASEHEQELLTNYVGVDEVKEINWLLIRLALASVSDLAVIPLQDIWGLDNTARMNMPGTATGNWAWRYSSNDLLTSDLSDRLRNLTQLYSR
ncbi:4-alpha-glucanotransferase [Synechococcus sp. PCC 7502]|uniref:4-alpha-glucanotransferase n=1 Tax=Synechococcus sp. PCC 7502 TaxID=1173263 RepID=UPI00029FC373|nr:4-alpha-glucanotransferase [Synechococcus sp. PCC 7502]AFY73613.1 4-alpha-glucanotransferase [Synechococcus sp. PCC 7502]